MIYENNKNLILFPTFQNLKIYKEKALDKSKISDIESSLRHMDRLLMKKIENQISHDDPDLITFLKSKDQLSGYSGIKSKVDQYKKLLELKVPFTKKLGALLEDESITYQEKDFRPVFSFFAKKLKDELIKFHKNGGRINFDQINAIIRSDKNVDKDTLFESSLAINKLKYIKDALFFYNSAIELYTNAPQNGHTRKKMEFSDQIYSTIEHISLKIVQGHHIRDNIKHSSEYCLETMQTASIVNFIDTAKHFSKLNSINQDKSNEEPFNFGFDEFLYLKRYLLSGGSLKISDGEFVDFLFEPSENQKLAYELDIIGNINRTIFELSDYVKKSQADRKLLKKLNSALVFITVNRYPSLRILEKLNSYQVNAFENINDLDIDKISAEIDMKLPLLTSFLSDRIEGDPANQLLKKYSKKKFDSFDKLVQVYTDLYSSMLISMHEEAQDKYQDLSNLMGKINDKIKNLEDIDSSKFDLHLYEYEDVPDFPHDPEDIKLKY